MGTIQCALASGVSAATAAPCTLQWDGNTDPSVTGYAVYYGLIGGSTNRFDAGPATSATLYTLTATSNYFFYVVAYNATGMESPGSNVVAYKPPVLSSIHLARAADGSMYLWFFAAPGTRCLVECTSSLLPFQWTILGSATADASGTVALKDPPAGRPPSRFYRAVRP